MYKNWANALPFWAIMRIFIARIARQREDDACFAGESQ